MIARLLSLILRAPSALIFLLTLISLLAASGIPRLEIDVRLEALLPADDPARSELREMLDTFGPERRTLVVLKDQALWTPAGLQRLQSLEQALQTMPQVVRVESVFSASSVTADQGRLIAKPLLQSAPNTESDAQDLRKRIFEQPLVRGELLADSDTAALLKLTLHEPDNAKQMEAVHAEIEAQLAVFRSAGTELFQFGTERLRAEIQQTLYRDLVWLLPIALVTLVCVMLVGLRCGIAGALPVITAGLTILWTIGAMGWLGVPLNLLSVLMAALILVIGSTEDAHLVAAYLRGLPESGHGDRTRAVQGMLKQVGLPIILTILTSALGVAGNVFSNLPLLREFAMAAALALLLNGVITLVITPLLLIALGPKTAAVGLGSHSPSPLASRVDALFRRLQAGQPVWLLAIIGAVCLFLLPSLMQLRSGSDELSFLPHNHALNQQARFLDEQFKGSRSFSVVLDAGREQAFLQPNNLRAVAAVQAALDADGVFANSHSYADDLAAVHRSLRGAYGALGDYELPETAELIAQALLFMRRSDLAPLLSQDGRKARIVVRHAVSDPVELANRMQAFEERAKHLAGEGIEVRIVGEALLLQRATSSLVQKHIFAIGGLILALALLVAALCTSVRAGLLALAPVLLPLVLGYGALALSGASLNLGTALVAFVVVGTAIDGTLHLLLRYVDQARRAMNSEQALSLALHAEATPITIAGVGLGLGFATFSVSSLAPIAQFGQLAAVTMLGALITNLVIMPLLLTRLRVVGLHQIVALQVDPEILANAPLFAGMTPYQRRKAVLISQWQEFEAAELLMKQGAQERSMYLILKGKAEVVRRDFGKARPVAEICAGDLVGEVAYIQAATRTADVRAVTRVTALRFDHERLQHDLRHFPSVIALLNMNISRILGLRLSELVENGSQQP